MATVYLGLGSNLGDRRHNISKALDLLSKALRLHKISSIYETEPVGFSNQPKFLNAVCEMKTNLSPLQLLTFIKGIETKSGRKPSFKNAPRIIDIDILLYNNKIVNTPVLTIPHPALVERAFVLIPLAEIRPELKHPKEKKPVSELLDAVSGKEGVQPWVPYGGI